VHTLKAVFFDLDNTLYDARDYYASAFHEIAVFISSAYGISEGKINETLWNTLQNKGTLYSKLFDEVLASLGIDDPDCVGRLVDMFHNAPTSSIKLYQDAGVVLPRLASKYKLGLITNGNSEMQRRKVEALGLSSFLQVQVYTDEVGQAKPSVLGYQQAVQIANVNPEESMYVGDNPCVDFIGAKKIGMYTVRILRGEFAKVDVNPDFIDAEVRDLCKLEKLLASLTSMRG